MKLSIKSKVKLTDNELKAERDFSSPHFGAIRNLRQELVNALAASKPVKRLTLKVRFK